MTTDQAKPIAYLISDGTVDDFTKVYIATSAEDLDLAVRHFAAHTHTPQDQIVINPIMAPVAETEVQS